MNWIMVGEQRPTEWVAAPQRCTARFQVGHFGRRTVHGSMPVLAGRLTVGPDGQPQKITGVVERVAPRHPQARLVGQLHRAFGQPRLADPGRTADQHEPARTRGGGQDRRTQPRDLLMPSDGRSLHRTSIAPTAEFSTADTYRH